MRKVKYELALFVPPDHTAAIFPYDRTMASESFGARDQISPSTILIDIDGECVRVGVGNRTAYLGEKVQHVRAILAGMAGLSHLDEAERYYTDTKKMSPLIIARGNYMGIVAPMGGVEE